MMEQIEHLTYQIDLSEQQSIYLAMLQQTLDIQVCMDFSLSLATRGSSMKYLSSVLVHIAIQTTLGMETYCLHPCPIKEWLSCFWECSHCTALRCQPLPGLSADSHLLMEVGLSRPNYFGPTQDNSDEPFYFHGTSWGSSKAGFLKFGTSDILGWVILVKGLSCALQNVQHHSCPLPTRCQYQSLTPSPSHTKKCLQHYQIFLGEGGRGKLPPVENHWAKVVRSTISPNCQSVPPPASRS